jgi:hypothetical protein
VYAVPSLIKYEECLERYEKWKENPEWTNEGSLKYPPVSIDAYTWGALDRSDVAG